MPLDRNQPPRDETGPGGNDMPPSGEEARAQKTATSMPLIWLLLGLVVVLGFAILMGTMRQSERSRGAPPTATESLPPVKQPAG